jgi:hypothetical protein
MSYQVLTVVSLLSWQIRWYVGVEDVSARLAILVANSPMATLQYAAAHGE